MLGRFNLRSITLNYDGGLTSTAQFQLSEKLVIKYSGDLDPGNWVFNGRAAALSQPITSLGDEVLRICDSQSWSAGSIYWNQKIPCDSFSTEFKFRIHTHYNSGADGIVFVVANSTAAVGNTGYAIGYEGINPSVAVEFDTWHNAYDPSENHIGVNLNGNITSVATANISPDFENGNIWTAWVDYDGSVLRIRCSDNGVRPVNPQLTYSVDIPATLGATKAYFGFTSGTGTAWSHHDLHSWKVFQ